MWMGRYGMEGVAEDMDIPWEPASHGEIGIVGITSCKELWRACVRNLLVMGWMEHGYALL